MIPVNTLITKLNNIISAGNLSALELAQIYGAIDSLTKNGVNSVYWRVDLPAAENNKGRFFYIESEGDYVLSNGLTWATSNILILADINAYSWGSNSLGQIGDGTTVSKSSPVSVLGGFTDWIDLRNGVFHTIGLRANGSIWSWGANNYGQLGDGTSTSKSSPVSILGGYSDWIQISANSTGQQNLALRSNGTIWGWGDNGSGQLGDNSVTNRSSPVSVVGGFTDWIQVSTGDSHSLGLRANGTAWAWGSGGNGRLGDGTTTGKSSPVSVVGGFTDWTKVSAGREHNVAIRANGSAWAWGTNNYGQLGNFSYTSQSSPVSVSSGALSNGLWIDVTGGNGSSAGIRSTGVAWAWGRNSFGRLGDNTTSNRTTPVSVVGGFTDWIQISVGELHTLGLRANGTAWAWGHNLRGQLGDGTTVSRSSPVSVIGGFTSWINISGGQYSSSGVRG